VVGLGKPFLCQVAGVLLVSHTLAQGCSSILRHLPLPPRQPSQAQSDRQEYREAQIDPSLQPLPVAPLALARGGQCWIRAS
jgi:hypothetical protein